MSRRALERIPSQAQSLLYVYDAARKAKHLVTDPAVKQVLSRTSHHSQQLRRAKLGQAGPAYTEVQFKRSDYAPVMRDLVGELFKKPIEVQPRLALQRPRPDHSTPLSLPLFLDPAATIKGVSQRQRRLLTQLGSWYNPYRHIPEFNIAQNAYIWFERLLANTPIVFFLRQRQRLMSGESLLEMNLPLQELTSELGTIQSRYAQDADISKRTRNYHLTELPAIDIFQLALAGEGSISLEHRPSEAYDQASWDRLLSTPDWLAQHLHKLYEPRFTGKNNQHVQLASIPEVKDVRRIYTMKEVGRLVDDGTLFEQFPYDLCYNEIFALTIESPVLTDDHLKLLGLLASQKNFEIMAVRVVKLAALIAGYNEPNQTYESLIKLIQDEGRGKLTVMERLGEWGFVNVSENNARTAFYMYK